MQGGTGSLSSELYQPSLLPDRFESGTPNVAGIAGLAEGLRFVLQQGARQIGAHEHRLTGVLACALEKLPAVQVFRSPDAAWQGGVLSFRHASLPCESIAECLAEQGVCVRAGLHCAPLAHRSAGTLETGTVRVSLGPFNTEQEVLQLAGLLCRICEKV